MQSIHTPEDLGKVIRARRKQAGVTQAELAGLAAVGTRFVGDVEGGKPTAELGKVLRLLDRLGLRVAIVERGGQR
jgi:y4mF family transcriptional regulator